MRGESVAGSPSGSSPGKATCAVISEATPASTAIPNGTRSSPSRMSRRASTTGRVTWESAVVRPCPGKCLAQASAPAVWHPSTQFRTMVATRWGSAPKARVWTIGFSGTTSRSATGANTQLIPTARASRAVTDATQRTAAASSRAARASGGGNSVRPSICWPAPRSRSEARSSGRSARRRRSEVSRRTDSTVPPKMMNPPTPRSSASAMAPASWAKPLPGRARSAGMTRRAVGSAAASLMRA
jgi:hypothetical protein